MEQDYVLSFSTYSKDPQFKAKQKDIETQITTELFGEKKLHEVPDALTKEITVEIKEFARIEAEKILTQLSSKNLSKEIIQSHYSFEMAKLDDIIYIKYGFKNSEVLAAFKKYNLLPQRETANLYQEFQADTGTIH
jgi:hypothetical protein